MKARKFGQTNQVPPDHFKNGRGAIISTAANFFFYTPADKCNLWGQSLSNLDAFGTVGKKCCLLTVFKGAVTDINGFICIFATI